MKVPNQTARDRVSLEVSVDRDNIDPDSGEVRLHGALIEAAQWVNSIRTTFRTSQGAAEFIGDRWNSHPDRMAIEAWLNAKAHPEDSRVVYFVCEHIITEWQTLPKRTKRQHKALFDEIVEASSKLRSLLENTGSAYYRGGGHGLQSALVCDLFTDEETADITDVVDAWSEDHPIDYDDDGEDGLRPVVRPAWSCFPTLEDLLRRLESAAARISSDGPMHSQPNKRGAMTGYFVRRLAQLLRVRYGEAPPSVLAAMATVALGETVDEDLARKHLGLAERSIKK